jgi:hypothetical protein
MAFISGDLMVVNRNGVDYKALIEDLLAVAEGQVNDAPLTIKSSDGTVLGTFTANAELPVEVVLPPNFSGDYNDLINLPTIGEGDITITVGGGLSSTGDASHNANQTGDTVQTLTVKTGGGLEINANGEVVVKPGAGIEIDLDGNVVIDPTFDLSSQVSLALGDLTDVNDADANPGEVLVQLQDGTYGFKDIAELPAAVHPKGFIQVKETAPADPEAGDLYIQHDPTGVDLNGQVADASFVGIAGETIEEGTFVFFGADDQWHAGGTIGGVEGIQSDWAETDNDSLAFIKNKPCVFECNTYIPNLTELP